MNTYTYETGRDYGAPQILEITAPSEFDQYALVSVDFDDAVRGIYGTVQILGFDVTPFRIGSAVLAAYDVGQYQIRTFVNKSN